MKPANDTMTESMFKIQNALKILSNETETMQKNAILIDERQCTAYTFQTNDITLEYIIEQDNEKPVQINIQDQNGIVSIRFTQNQS